MPGTQSRDLSSSSNLRVHRLIERARLGLTDELGQLLESYRNYLHLLATTHIDSKLRAKIGASDLVQETMVGAYRDFAQFRGHNERQLLAWLRRILINRLHVLVQRHVLAEKRDVRREIPLEEVGAALSRSTARLDAGLFLADRAPSPSSHVIQRENGVLLADHLARMPAPYREVLILRNLRGLTFEEVAQRMGRKTGATRMLWLRAIRQLRERISGDEQQEGNA
jgi:RNA polymerase sigma-70 factor (ECF subfamily)